MAMRRWNYYIKFFFFFCFFFSFSVWSGETTLEVKQDSPDIRKAVQTAIGKVSVELMERFIESSKLKAQKKRIQQIISKYSNRYILYTQTAPVVKKDDESFTIFVTIGFSEENLKKILLKEDFFYSDASHLRILPLILFENLVHDESHGWWMKNGSPSELMKKQMTEFYNRIQDTLMSYGFFLINPEWAGSEYFIPDDLQFKKPKKKHVFSLAKFFQSYLVMTGSVKVRESDIDAILNIKVELTIYNADSGRLLAEMERFEKIYINKKDEKNTEPVIAFLKKNKNFAKGLGVQLKSIYETGQLSSNLLKITVLGNLSYREFDRFKQLLNSEVRDIKDLKEHIIRSRSVTYIANIGSDVKAVSEKIKDTLFPGFRVQVSRVRKNEVSLKVVVAEK